MPYLTPDTAVTGNIITAADGNRRRDNDEYFKGNAGPIAIGASTTVTGSVVATGNTHANGIAVGVGGVQSGPGPSNQLLFHDRTTNQAWVWYAHGGLARIYTPIGAEPIQIGVNGNITFSDVIDLGMQPGRLSAAAQTGFQRYGGTWTYGYNGDDTVAWASCSGGSLSGYALTYEYSGGNVAAVRLRAGGIFGGIVASISYGYDGSGRVSTETHT
jgi:hypothetical protein